MRAWLCLTAALLGAAPANALDAARIEAAGKAQEAALGARLGLAVLDTGDGARAGYRADERFPFCSTHKAYACAALLARVEKGDTTLETHVTIRPSDLVAYSPITEELVAPASPTLADMCAAALAVSDNTAANQVLAAEGGPAGFTAYLRGLGDPASRLDRTETSLNEAAPGDVRDTTTPDLAVSDLDKILLGDALKPGSRAQLTKWMEGDRVAGALLRASLPQGWRIADKTGAGERGARGIVAVLWPPDRAPLVVAIYLTETKAAMDARNAAIARIGAEIVKAVQP